MKDKILEVIQFLNNKRVEFYELGHEDISEVINNFSTELSKRL